MKQILTIACLLTFLTSCGPVKLADLTERAVANQSLIMVFSRKVRDPFTLTIDDQPVPIVAPARGKRLEVKNLKPGKHQVLLRSDYYIFSEPFRTIDFQPAEKKGMVLVIGTLHYFDESAAPADAEQPTIWRRTVGLLTFWKKKTAGARKIDTSSVYAEFTD